MCVYIYIYIYIYSSLSLYIYIYINSHREVGGHPRSRVTCAA